MKRRTSPFPPPTFPAGTRGSAAASTRFPFAILTAATACSSTASRSTRRSCAMATSSRSPKWSSNSTKGRSPGHAHLLQLLGHTRVHPHARRPDSQIWRQHLVRGDPPRQPPFPLRRRLGPPGGGGPFGSPPPTVP